MVNQNSGAQHRPSFREVEMLQELQQTVCSQRLERPTDTRLFYIGRSPFICSYATTHSTLPTLYASNQFSPTARHFQIPS
jgi:hypothetical protein